MAANWLLEGGLKDKIKRFFNNKAAIILCSFFVMHLLGLLYTSPAGMDYGLEDVRKKLPLFLLPLVFSTSYAITEKEKKVIMLCFMLSVTYVTIYGTYLLLNHKLNDIHEISPYVDAVRLAMMIVLSIFLLVRYVFTTKWSWLSAVLLLWSVWLFSFLFIMQSLTEAIVFVILATLILLYRAFTMIKRNKRIYGIIILSFAGLLIISSIGYLIHFEHKYFPKPERIVFSKLDSVTAHGTQYLNDTNRSETENGHYVNIYICWPELKTAWEERSKLPFDSNDSKDNLVKFTMIRYMSSKGLRKDMDGVKQLSDKDIRAIEDGMPNYSFSSLTSMKYRIYQVLWEMNFYKHGGNPSGHSFAQRLEFWRAATGIIKQHPLLGVGTGDVKIAFADEYNQIHSSLTERWRLRSHNQWLEIGVAFGIIGMLWFGINLFYPAFKTKRIYTYAYFVFWIILMISICTEDTLETQAGATFYAFFNAFFLFL
jgi:hypothetical protein